MVHTIPELQKALTADPIAHSQFDNIFANFVAVQSRTKATPEVLVNHLAEHLKLHMAFLDFQDY